jgi:DNA-binding LytR/AlgR family response regulator
MRTSVTQPAWASGLCVLVVGPRVEDRDALVGLLSRSLAVGAVHHAADVAAVMRLLDEADVDAVFVDIALPGLDGIAMAKVLGRFVSHPEVVLVADDPDKAAEAFEVGVLDYLQRPVGADRLAESLRRVGQRRAPGMPMHRGRNAGLTEGRSLVAVEVTDRAADVASTSVRWMEVNRDYVRVHTDRGSELLNISLGKLVDAWASIGMVRIHRSYAVRIAAVSELRKSGANHTVVVDERELPISRRYAKRVTDQLLGDVPALRRQAAKDAA